jgi:hypothetical protein
VGCSTGLRERHLGELEGKTPNEARLQCPRAWEVLQGGSFSDRIPVRPGFTRGAQSRFDPEVLCLE